MGRRKTFKNILRAFHKNYHYKFNPDIQKVSDIVPLFSSIRCPSGESYEMELPKGADMKPPRDYHISLGAYFL